MYIGTPDSTLAVCLGEISNNEITLKKKKYKREKKVVAIKKLQKGHIYYEN